MPKRNLDKPFLRAEAVVHRIDPVNRELTAFVDGVPVTIYVPPNCEIFLRGERVRLRMIQPRDRLQVAYTLFADFLVARAIEVRLAYPSPLLLQ